MNRTVSTFIAMILICGLVFSGCGWIKEKFEKEPSTAKEAVDISETLDTVEKKTQYLLDQADAFMNRKDFQESIKLSKYILLRLDDGSKEASSLLRKAQSAMAVQLQMQQEEKEAQ